MRKFNLMFILIFFVLHSAAFAEVGNEYSEKRLSVVASSTDPEFTIKIQSNPSTGFSWFLRDYNDKLLQPLTRKVLSAEKVGEAQYEVWTFRLKPAAFIVPQQTLIRFVYVRPWENEEASKQLVFKISTK